MRAVTPIDVAIRTIPGAWFAPVRRIYRADIVLSAALAWSTIAMAMVATGRARAALLIVTAFSLYRAVLFIYGITHLAQRDVPGLRLASNALVGVPLLLPSFLYEGVHTDTLAADSPYAATAEPDIVTAVAGLVRRASRSHR